MEVLLNISKLLILQTESATYVQNINGGYAFFVGKFTLVFCLYRTAIE